MKNDKKNQTLKSSYREILKDDESLAKFLRAMTKFDRLFCEGMMEGREFTLRLEIKGNRYKMIHCRVGQDEWDKVESGK